MISHDDERAPSLDDGVRRARGRLSRNFVASAKVTLHEQQELESAAKREGKALSEWAREVLLREARSSSPDAHFSELIALRMMLTSLLKPVCCGEVITAEAFAAELQNIRTTKQQVAQDVRQQYQTTTLKEQ